MEQADVIGALGDPRARALLESPLLARVAYIGLDGGPRVIPVGFLWSCQEIVVCTATTAPKVRALRERPQVALTIDNENAPPQALLIRGAADIEMVDGVPDEYIAASAKTMDAEQLKAFEAQVRSVYKQMARLAITPEWAKLFDFGTGQLPAFLQRLVGTQA